MLVGVSFDSALEESMELTLIASKSGTESNPDSDSIRYSEDVDPEMEAHFFRETETDIETKTSAGRFIAPPPEMSPEKKQEFLSRQGGEAMKYLKHTVKLRQTTLPLEIVSKGRFEKSRPTIHNGEDLDIPTYIRKGVVLN